MNLDSEALISRQQATEALNALGFRIAGNTLAHYAVRGKGPPFLMFGRRCVYRYGDLISWAHASMRPPKSVMRRTLQNAA